MKIYDFPTYDKVPKILQNKLNLEMVYPWWRETNSIKTLFWMKILLDLKKAPDFGFTHEGLSVLPF